MVNTGNGIAALNRALGLDYGYRDLPHGEYVYKALLGHGLFFAGLPPCFTSEALLTSEADKALREIGESPHAYIQYAVSRHNNIPRQLAIPHPIPYMQLCKEIRKNWEEVNLHIGKAKPKFNYCHVRRIVDEPHIFEMNYLGADKWQKEELANDYSIGASLVVLADIATCFPSIYTHSIPWAVQGKGIEKKKHRDSKTHWSNMLDERVRYTKDNETNGLLVGPHASNIISEIILTQIDVKLRKAGYSKVIRHIDDYIFYAVDEKKARGFLKDLGVFLKEYELLLNSKKVKILPYEKYLSSEWASKLARFSFPAKI